jgi:hypothetical protein
VVELRGGGCYPKWAVAFVKPGEEPDVAFSLECGAGALRVAPGTTRLPFTMPATYLMCSNNQNDAAPRCLPGNGAPPLAPGQYQAKFATLGGMGVLQPPDPVDVTVTP